MEKKNGKSTPDIKNEMLKRPGEAMIEILYPLVCTIWNEETVPKQWNKGNITSIWKGRGDKELLSNHRGITTSSAIGTIFDSLIDKRIEHLVPYTEAQGGGKKGASTYDHLFLLRAMIDISIKQKRQSFFTFFDVCKAYDNADNEDMLTVIWDSGLRGKSWRILKELCTDLKASIKTRYGMTRTVDMDIGGKQGSRLTGRKFSKTMDTMAEDMIENQEGFQLVPSFKIPVLLWVDDVVSCTEGKTNQNNVLKKVDEFAVKHKLEWGAHKCKVMRVGRHKEKSTEWQLGRLQINETSQYKYLGDEITSNGKNTENIKARKQKLQGTIASINTIASNEVLSRIESCVLLELHERIAIPGLLNNSQSWVLNKTETIELEKAEIQALKILFQLPTRTPKAAVIFTFGILFTRQRIDQNQLIYLHRTLQRPVTHWVKKTLLTLEELDIGWVRNIKSILTFYQLPTSFDEIKSITFPEWTNFVKTAIEKKNIERLRTECHKPVNGVQTPKTKTASIIPKIDDEKYIRQPETSLIKTTKKETKTTMMARYGLLECGINYKGTHNEICDQCNCVDDENHRLNFCIKYETVNLYNNPVKVDYDDVYSDDIEKVRKVNAHIEKIWNTCTAQGTMNV